MKDGHRRMEGTEKIILEQGLGEKKEMEIHKVTRAYEVKRIETDL